MSHPKTPYSEDFDPLPMEELARMLRMHRMVFRKGAKGWKEKISVNDIAKEVKVHHHALACIMQGKEMPTKHPGDRIGKRRLQRLSRFLLKAACGMIVKRDGVILYLDAPTKPMPIVRRVELGGLTGPVLSKPVQHAAPRSMPKFMEIFRAAPTIRLPKGLSR